MKKKVDSPSGARRVRERQTDMSVSEFLYKLVGLEYKLINILRTDSIGGREQVYVNDGSAWMRLTAWMHMGRMVKSSDPDYPYMIAIRDKENYNSFINTIARHDIDFFWIPF